MRKNAKAIIIAVLLFLLLSIIFFFFCDLYSNTPFRTTKDIKTYFRIYKNKTETQLVQSYIYKNDNKIKIHHKKIENISSDNLPILIFGDTHTYGNHLKEKETFAHNLSKYTNRPVYNQSSPFVKPQQIYFQLTNKKFYKIFNKHPKIILYVYTRHNIIEVYTKCARSSHDLFYKLKNGRLVRYERIPFYKKSFFVARINAYLFDKKEFQPIYAKIGEKMYKTLVIESKNEAQKHWGKDVRFVIIRLFKPNNDWEDKIFEDLKKEDGIVIFEAYKYIDTSSEKYLVKEILPKMRASGKMWETLVPIMVKELGI